MLMLGLSLLLVASCWVLLQPKLYRLVLLSHLHTCIAECTCAPVPLVTHQCTRKCSLS